MVMNKKTGDNGGGGNVPNNDALRAKLLKSLQTTNATSALYISGSQLSNQFYQVQSYSLYVPLDKQSTTGLIVYDQSMQIVKTVNLPQDANSTISGSYIDASYLYVWGDFGVAMIYVDPEGFYPTKLDNNMDLVIGKPEHGNIQIMDLKEDTFNLQSSIKNPLKFLKKKAKGNEVFIAYYNSTMSGGKTSVEECIMEYSTSLQQKNHEICYLINELFLDDFIYNNMTGLIAGFHHYDDQDN